MKSVLCMQRCNYHRIARLLADTLNPVLQILMPFYVKDPFELAEALENFPLNSRWMQPIDMDSPSTNAPS